MKKLFFISTMFVSSLTNAQTIDTNTARPFSVVRFATPFQVCFNDTTKAHYLMVESSSDNFKDKVILNYALFAAPYTNLVNGISIVIPAKMIFTGTLEMTGSAYTTWKTKATIDTDRKYIFQFVADKLNLAIL